MGQFLRLFFCLALLGYVGMAMPSLLSLISGEKGFWGSSWQGIGGIASSFWNLGFVPSVLLFVSYVNAFFAAIRYGFNLSGAITSLLFSIVALGGAMTLAFKGDNMVGKLLDPANVHLSASFACGLGMLVSSAMMKSFGTLK